ncbi:MAG: hypothetical protein ACYDG6_01995 [Thermincolia bacterium]
MSKLEQGYYSIDPVTLEWAINITRKDQVLIKELLGSILKRKKMIEREIEEAKVKILFYENKYNMTYHDFEVYVKDSGGSDEQHKDCLDWWFSLETLHQNQKLLQEYQSHVIKESLLSEDYDG